MKQLSLLILMVSHITCSAQGIKGTIWDEHKQPISFATIYIESLQIGTTANLDGVYEINLGPGEYKVTFRSLGYKPVTKKIKVSNAFITLDMTLLTQAYLMKEVTITSDGEDFAYSIMRKVIAWSNYHLNQVSHYQSEVYLKGTLVMDKIPKLLQKLTKANANDVEINLKNGQVYISESENEIVFDAPNKYTQKVKSSKSSFPDGNDQSPIGYINSSFYEPNVLGCISPLSPQAFSHYKFVFEGFSQEGEYIVDKIKVISRRKSQQLFNGYIYIVEQQWCLNSVDLYNEQFWGNIRINQIFAPVKNDAWLPVSHNYYIEASIIGVKANYKYVASVKYNDIKTNDQLRKPVPLKKEVLSAIDSVEKKKPTKKQEEMEQMLNKDKLTYKDMRKIVRAAREEEKKNKKDTTKSREIKENQNYVVKNETVKRDSSYWTSYRPVPLTIEELKSYHQKDSISMIKAQSPKKDTSLQGKGQLVIGMRTSKDTSSSKKTKKLNWVNQVLFSHSWAIKNSPFNVKYYGLVNPDLFAFNTVDGWVYGQKINIITTIDSVHSLSISPQISYALNRKAWMWNVDGHYQYAPKQRGHVYFGTGVTSSDFNQESGIHKHVNSIASLFFRRNYMKFFENRYYSLKNEIDLANGLQVTIAGKYFEPSFLENHSDYSFFYRKTRDYTSNIPDSAYFLKAQSINYRGLDLSVGLNYTPGSYYRIEHHSKIMEKSKYPTFKINYIRGLDGIFNSNSSYHHLNGGVKHDVVLRNEAKLIYTLTYGKFFDVKQIHFSEYKHFNTQFLPVMVGELGMSFQLLDYYKFSTSDQYLEGHLHYNTKLLLLKHLPWISQRIWTENVYLNYLNTPSLSNYVELGYGLGSIWAIGNVGVFTSFKNGQYHSVGIKISIGIKD